MQSDNELLEILHFSHLCSHISLFSNDFTISACRDFSIKQKTQYLLISIVLTLVIVYNFCLIITFIFIWTFFLVYNNNNRHHSKYNLFLEQVSFIVIKSLLMDRGSPVKTIIQNILCPGDFPGSPVVETLPSSAGGVGLTPGQGTKILYAARCRKKTNSFFCGSIVRMLCFIQGQNLSHSGSHPWSRWAVRQS